MSPNIIKDFLIYFIRVIHFFLLIFLLLGWLFSSQNILLIHLLLIPLVILHWWTNSGACFLTQIEHRLSRVSSYTRRESQGEFSRSLLAKLFGIELTNRQLAVLIYSCLVLSWMLSLLRFIYF